MPSWSTLWREGGICDALLHLHRPEARERLVALGRRNQKRFSWGKASKETWRLLLEVAQNGKIYPTSESDGASCNGFK